MKNLLRALVILAVLALAGLSALTFWVGPRVEEQVRQALAWLPENLNILERSHFAPSEIKEVQFSPFSRRLVLRGLELRGTMDLPAPAGDGEHQPQTASLAYTAEEISYRLPWRALLLYTPLRDMVLPETGMMSVGEDMRISNLSYVFTQGSVSARSVLQSQEANDLRMESGLIREMLEQRKSLDMLNVFYRMGIGEIRGSAMTTEMTIPEAGQKVGFSCGSMRFRNWEGRAIEEASMDGIVLTKNDREFMRLGNITEKQLTMPEEADIRELLALISQPKPDEKALLLLLQRIVTTGEPLLREISFSDLHFPLDDQALTIKKIILNWQSNTPLKYSLGLDAMSLPMTLVEGESGLTFPGLPVLVLDAKLSFTDQDDGRRHKGLLKAQDLGSLDYDFTMPADSLSPLANPQPPLLISYKGVNLKYTDQGLMAYLVNNFIPSAQAATPALKMAIAEVCSGDAPENAAIREALETFVTRPGVLEVQSKPGGSFRLVDFLATVGGKNPGKLLNVTAQPGKESLEEQISGLDATAAKAK